ncbi:cupin-like domain-containing protein [Synechococcus sp. PCC 7502]|uniref:cupin-like domain-containing protein n=1 Tax=Synechococcus sp. PCC 7502 TaxID=1173263 RepID=UPI00030179A8|nr:cupin-like domain-containing protein [Synechococcus sp. PCC 7502]
MANYPFNPSQFTPFQVVSKPITDNWRIWLAENKLLGSSDEHLVAEMSRFGFNAQAVKAELATIAASPYFQAGQNLAQLLRKLESHCQVQTALAALSPQSALTIDRHPQLSQAEFFENYYVCHRPVILTEATKNWQALNLWTPEFLRSQYGHIAVEIQANRLANRRYEIDVDAHRHSITLGEFVDMLAANTNDYYMVANNGNLSKTELRSLLNDIEMFPEYLDRTKAENAAFFWLGPAGTVTPLHHDACNLLFVQIYGRKTWKIIPPFNTPYLYNYEGVFSEVDCEQPDYAKYPLFKNVCMTEVTLEPGEAIFIPAGWWHHVRSLDVSISLSFTNFLFPNEYTWNYPQIRR